MTTTTATAATATPGMTTACGPEVGTVYLLHFDRPYHHARHHLGWTTNLGARLAAHTTGHGARLLHVITRAGIGWTLARTWTGTRTRERQLKNQGSWIVGWVARSDENRRWAALLPELQC